MKLKALIVGVLLLSLAHQDRTLCDSGSGIDDNDQLSGSG